MNSHAPGVDAGQVKALRAFNRFYTRRIGVLKRYLDSDFTLTEVRVMYEIAHREGLAASDLVRELGLDAGYLSRILKRFGTNGWLDREAHPRDARRAHLRLTEAGYAVFMPLQQRSRDEAGAMLAALPAAQRPRLIEAMGTVQQLMAAPAAAPSFVLRDTRPGDIGWVVQQHGELYCREYGYDAEFEALVAQIGARFILDFQPGWEKGWIAEVDGQRMGAVFVVRKSATVAQLRMLILRPEARGLGLGGRLVDECLAFARAKGYRKMVLWTNAQLTAARAIYKSRGFTLTKTEAMKAYGQKLKSETWELKL